VVDLGLLLLGDALGDPHDVSNLLLLEADPGVEYAVLEAHLEGELVELDLVLEERVLQRPVLVRRELPPNALQQRPVRQIHLDGVVDLFSLFSFGNSVQSFRIKETKCGIELLSIVSGQVCSEGIESDVDRTTICFKPEQFRHNFRRRTTKILTKFIKIFQIGLVEGVSDQFNIHFIQILLRQTILKEWGERSIHQNGIVQLGNVMRGQ